MLNWVLPSLSLVYVSTDIRCGTTYKLFHEDIWRMLRNKIIQSFHAIPSMALFVIIQVRLHNNVLSVNRAILPWRPEYSRWRTLVSSKPCKRPRRRSASSSAPCCRRFDSASRCGCTCEASIPVRRRTTVGSVRTSRVRPPSGPLPCPSAQTSVSPSSPAQQHKSPSNCCISHHRVDALKYSKAGSVVVPLY